MARPATSSVRVLVLAPHSDDSCGEVEEVTDVQKWLLDCRDGRGREGGRSRRSTLASGCGYIGTSLRH